VSGRASLYITNWSLSEPLCQSQSVPYLKALAARGYQSCLMTFERPPYALTGADADAARRQLADAGICWHPLAYHSRANIIGVAVDGARTLSTSVNAILRHGARIVHTRTSVPAALGLVAARLTRRRFLYDADSELSEEYADGGHWTRGGMSYRALSAMENLCRRQADSIVVLTERLRADFVRRGVRAPMTVIPCCIDTGGFRRDEGARAARRLELGIGDEILLVYVGKIGPRYMLDETMAFVGAAGRRGPVHMLILSHGDVAAFRSVAAAHGIADVVTVRSATHGEIPGWLSAADAGLALIRPTASECGSSPIKVSEYLAAGLPVVITDGIGDLSEAIDSSNLGVVVSGSGDASINTAVDRLNGLLQSRSVGDRCMAFARAALDVEQVALSRYASVYEILLASARSVSTVAVAGSK
jgi:glycosyltransferase involved in cell wall biosynthesis